MGKSKNFGLNLPDEEDFFNINDFNVNFEIVDDKLSHIESKSNPHGVTAAQLGLGNVNNTADSAKSVNYAASTGAAPWTGVSGKPTTLSGYGITDAVPSSRTVNGKALSGNVTITASDVGLGNVNNTADSAKNVASAAKLTTARTLQTNLGSTSAASFDGTANSSHGVTGILPVANGGTGNTTGSAAAAAKLTTARTLSATGDVTGSMSFDGSANSSMAVTLANSGVTAGSYGPTANATLTHGGTFIVPQVTVDAKGRATGVAARTLTLPATPTSVTGSSGSCTGNAATATKLATARTMTVNLASTTAASFDGTANVTPGVSGTLPVARGGTGNTTGTASAVAWSGVTGKPTTLTGYGITLSATVLVNETYTTSETILSSKTFSSLTSAVLSAYSFIDIRIYAGWYGGQVGGTTTHNYFVPYQEIASTSSGSTLCSLDGTTTGSNPIGYRVSTSWSLPTTGLYVSMWGNEWGQSGGVGPKGILSVKIIGYK